MNSLLSGSLTLRLNGFSQRCGCTDHHADGWGIAFFKATAKSLVIVVTEPLTTNENWIAMEPREFTVFVDGGVIPHKALDFYVAERVKELTKGQQSPVSITPLGVSDFPIALVRP